MFWFEAALLAVWYRKRNPLFPKWKSSKSSKTASCVVLVALASLAVLNMVVEEGRGESTETSTTTTVVLVALGSQAVLSTTDSSTASPCVVLAALAPLAVLE